MSIHISIQACCRVFKIGYSDMIQVQQTPASNGKTYFSPHVTARKFAAYFMCIQPGITYNQVSKSLNISYSIVEKYRRCIEELFAEDPRHYLILDAIDEEYDKIIEERRASDEKYILLQEKLKSKVA